jgi:hypothetical protein
MPVPDKIVESTHSHQQYQAIDNNPIDSDLIIPYQSISITDTACLGSGIVNQSKYLIKRMTDYLALWTKR